MYKSLLFIVLVLFFSMQRSDAQNFLSQNSEISVITCAAGEELYATFGHSALRVYDPENNMDLVFNYGTFDFNTPNFYLKFARGKLDYMLTVSNFKHYIQAYINEKRSVREQVLNLSPVQKDAVYAYLAENAQPENKYYLYDFFFDNCATRIADVLDEATREQIIFGSPELGKQNTFRLMLHTYLQDKDWTRFGINIIIGLPADRTVSNQEASFLPDYLETLLANSQIHKNDNYEPLVKEHKILYIPEQAPESKSNFFTPSRVLWTLFLLFLLFTGDEILRKKHYIEADRILLLLLGAAGLLITVMWTLTDHDAVVNNLNIVWAFPLHVAAAFFLTKPKAAAGIKIYFGIYTILLLLFLAFFIIKTYFFDMALLPLILILIMRSALIYVKADKRAV